MAEKSLTPELDAQLIAHRQAQTAQRREEMRRIRAAQDAKEQIANEVRERIGESEWAAIIKRNRTESIKRGQILEFYRDSSQVAQYRFRKETEAEENERISDWVEDNI
jgi:hypothetical protein